MNDLSQIIDSYLKRGFGSMNKNDFEVWIFYFLTHNQFHDWSNYEISIELRIPESKVKRLRYEAELKYGSPQDVGVYKDRLNKLLSKAVFKKDGDRIQFVIEDIHLRKYLDSLLKKEGRFSNTSFNSEIVSVDIEDLDFLIEKLWSNEDMKQLLEKAKKKMKKSDLTFKDLLKTFVSSAAKEAGKIFIDLSYSGLMSFFS